MRKQRLVMVGNGMAGMKTIEEILKHAPDVFDITVFGAEPHGNYNRILLSPVLAGEMTLADIMLNDLDWYSANGITLHAGRKVVEVDRVRRVVRSEDGTEEGYDRLLLATGSNPFIPPVPGRELEGVIAYRDIADTETMIEAACNYRHAVVIGGGLLGLEAANGLILRGMEVTVVHLGEWIMERQLDRPAAEMLQASLEAKGMRFRLGAQTEALLPAADDPAGRVAAVRLAGGETIAADLVVMSAGIRPNTALAESARLHCDRGIVVTDTMQTVTDPRIYAVGECVSHRGVAYGLVAPLFDQARVCANHLAGFGIGRYEGSVTSTKLKVTGVDVFSAGDFMGAEDCDNIVLHDRAGGRYKKLVLKDDRLIGAVMVGDTSDGSWYFQLVREGRNIAAMRDQLMFGQSFAQSQLGDAGHQGQNQAALLPDSAEVCGCNGVCKGTIVKAIKEKGLFSLDEVRKHTKASSSCGSCTGLVEQILASTVGGAYQAVDKHAKPVCGCTDHTHAEVRAAIREHKLLSIPAVMKALDWKTPNGCATCRPALNYYLVSTWPHEAEDDPQSRFINERAHANIQKDGTYSVVPRMWGGLTTPAELRAIADAAEKYQVPTVKVTGGQRIDLLGVKKDDLPAIWADLGKAGMVSGHAYGKSLRTVKTCVGAEHCRFGTQHSMRTGVNLEKMLFGMWSPHKVKLAVSGCPRNCAESGIKDVGVIGVDSGFEIYVAGNGGIKTEVAQFLCKVATEEDVKEMTGAFLQLYREEGFYLERTCHYVERVGLDYVKRLVVEDADSRRELHERLLYALKDAPDPWAEQQVQPLARHYKTIQIHDLSGESSHGMAESVSA
ncbi:nitrite reductase large subunit NirB [Azoarcus taiwanensis]|uniref:Nitrite reductase large subunit n=1 Tax=Azoarcus taiwanensis TaxID=666964 RepID=A0A972F5U5_9RHOO|nr:nitrite reductase large subunit NirB [Azoarcus taiwanensis]NMG01707.1 nitrite reductase large subunit [Azoarcus taiwanensis]